MIHRRYMSYVNKLADSADMIGRIYNLSGSLMKLGIVVSTEEVGEGGNVQQVHAAAAAPAVSRELS